jgi:hypothetical protein
MDHLSCKSIMQQNIRDLPYKHFTMDFAESWPLEYPQQPHPVIRITLLIQFIKENQNMV